jgi:hypothetical protein
LLDGSATAAAAVSLHTGLRRIDDMLQIFWFQMQIHRMADGLDPNPRLSKLCALLYAVRMGIKFRRARLASGDSGSREGSLAA